MMKKNHTNHEDFNDVSLGIRLTERLSDRLEEAAPINKSEFVRDAISRAIEEKLTVGAIAQ